MLSSAKSIENQSYKVTESYIKKTEPTLLHPFGAIKPA